MMTLLLLLFTLMGDSDLRGMRVPVLHRTRTELLTANGGSAAQIYAWAVLIALSDSLAFKFHHANSHNKPFSRRK
jgi:hypothetical protein